MLIMVMGWLVICGSEIYNQEITEFVSTRDAAGIHVVPRWKTCGVLPEEEDFANHYFLLSQPR